MTDMAKETKNGLGDCPMNTLLYAFLCSKHPFT